MSEEKKDYVVYGMRAKCSEGTMENYISTDVGHGVTYQGQPLLNANDHTKQVNLTHFGDCNSKKIYEEAKKQADEKYKADADDGFFAKAGKWVAKTVTKMAINVQEHLMFHKCELDTPLPWMFCNEEHMIDGAPALTMESQCPCRRGGVITIVPVEEEIEVTEEEVAMEPPVSETALASVSLLSAGEGVKRKDKINAQTKGKVKKEIEEKIERKGSGLSVDGVAGSESPIETYVNEETLGEINPLWSHNMDTFKEIYGEDVFEQMRGYMYEYGLTDEVSILMFLSTIGEETGYGTNVIQGQGYQEYDAEQRKQLEEVPQIDNNKGIGLIQITGATQGYFIKDLYNSLEKGDPERVRIEEYFKVTEEDLTGIPSHELVELDNTAGFIYMYYPIEASIWFWAGYKKNCALFGEDTQTDYTINEYIVMFKEANLNNVFLGMQYTVNSLPGQKNGEGSMSKSDVRDICNTQEDLANELSEEIIINEERYRMPLGWDDRIADWKEAQDLLSVNGEK